MIQQMAMSPVAHPAPVWRRLFVAAAMATFTATVTVLATTLAAPAQTVVAFVNGEPITSLDVDQRNGTVYTVWNTTGKPNDCDQAPGGTSCKPTAASTKQPDRVLVSVVKNGATSAPAPVVVASQRRHRPSGAADSLGTSIVDQSAVVGLVKPR